MATLLRPALSLMVLMIAITGVIYPLTVTGIAQLAFPSRPTAAWCAMQRATFAAPG